MFSAFVGSLCGFSSFWRAFPRKTVCWIEPFGLLGRLSCSPITFQQKRGGVSLAEPCRWDLLLCKPGLPPCKTLYHRWSYPVEVLEVELFEDGVSAFHLVPPHGSQVCQQLLPLLCAQPVGLSCLTPQKGKGRGADQRGRSRMKQMFKAVRHA